LLIVQLTKKCLKAIRRRLFEEKGQTSSTFRLSPVIPLFDLTVLNMKLRVIGRGFGIDWTDK
jgi:hypothetical protein